MRRNIFDKTVFGRYKVEREEMEAIREIFNRIRSCLSEYEDLFNFSIEKNKIDRENSKKKIKFVVEKGVTTAGKQVGKTIGNMVPVPVVGGMAGSTIGKKVGKVISHGINNSLIDSAVDKHFLGKRSREKDWEKNPEILVKYQNDENEKRKIIDANAECIDGGEGYHIITSEEDSLIRQIDEFYRDMYVYGIQCPSGFKSQETLSVINHKILTNNQNLKYKRFYEVMSKYAGPTATQIETSVLAAEIYIKEKYGTYDIGWKKHKSEYNGMLLNLFRAGLDVHAEELGWPKGYATKIADEIYETYDNTEIDITIVPHRVEENIQKLLQ